MVKDLSQDVDIRVIQQFKKFFASMKSEGSLSCLQKTALYRVVRHLHPVYTPIQESHTVMGIIPTQQAYSGDHRIAIRRRAILTEVFHTYCQSFQSFLRS
jgi:hypothetical protein